MCGDKSQWLQFASLIADGEFICLFAVCTAPGEMSIHVFFFCSFSNWFCTFEFCGVFVYFRYRFFVRYLGFKYFS